MRGVVVPVNGPAGLLPGGSASGSRGGAAAGGEAGSVWEERYSSRHSRPYWTNTQTGESTWQDPNAAAAAAPQQYGY